MSTTATGAMRPAVTHAVTAGGSVTTQLGTVIVRVEATTGGTLTFASSGATVTAVAAIPEYFKVSASGDTIHTATFVGNITEMAV